MHASFELSREAEVTSVCICNHHVKLTLAEAVERKISLKFSNKQLETMMRGPQGLSAWLNSDGLHEFSHQMGKVWINNNDLYVAFNTVKRPKVLHRSIIEQNLTP